MSIKLVKAFSNNPEQGNPAGVCLDASGLSDEQMQDIAAELGFSESAFVFPSDVADYKVRFFTPTEEVGYCGHATVATYFELFNLPENTEKTTLTQDTKAGVFTIEKTSDNKIMMTQRNPEFLETETIEELCSNLDIEHQVFNQELPIQVVKCNVYELIVPFATPEKLKNFAPESSKIMQHTADKKYHGIYCFAVSEDGELYARSFAPEVGIVEDPATGVAAGPLACYADKYIFGGAKKQINISQGMWMGKASSIFVDLSNGVKVGGYATEFGEYKN
ncbi:MAG: PhzF family phenazine biosynthesis protein [Candidatus Saccharibacteria bacterium]|nr:PhzF family phenazine biosynthesis protein [Candidatus Saccharibacteria bacterium]